MNSRKLVLKREALSALASGELEGVVGAASGGPSCGGTCLEPRCHVVIDVAPSVKPTCQQTICPSCPI